MGVCEIYPFFLPFPPDLIKPSHHPLSNSPLDFLPLFPPNATTKKALENSPLHVNGTAFTQSSSRDHLRNTLKTTRQASVPFKSISKPWLALIADPQFIKSHLHHSVKNNMNQKLVMASKNSKNSDYSYSVDYKAPGHTLTKLDMPCTFHDILGSFNGVLLLDSGVDLCLWNPTIRIYQKFSQPSECRHNLMIYGLGYDSTGDEFKVVGLALYLTPVTVHVFSSKLSSWKIVGEFGYDQIDVDARVPILNGKPHWFVNRDWRIVCFDATEEKFREVPRPNYGSEDHLFDMGVLGGWLCVVVNRQRTHHSDVWAMKDYGVKESWTKLFVVRNVEGEFFFYHFDLLSFTADGEVVMVLNSKLVQLVIYNQKQKRFKRIGIPKDWEEFDVALHYVESLVSPYVCNDSRRLS